MSDFSDLILYLKTVWLLWIAVVGGGFIIVADQMLPNFNERYRKWASDHGAWRKGLILGFYFIAFVWAGFAAWQGQRTEFLNEQKLRTEADKDVVKWRTAAEERQKLIDDLKKRPADVITRVVERPVYIPSGPARSKHSEVLQKSYEAGAVILRRALTIKTSDEDVEKANEFAGQWSAAVSA